VQEYKEPKVEMYKSIWDLMFKCNGSGIRFKSIQFSQEYSNQRNVRKESKDKCLRLRDPQPLTIEVEPIYLKRVFTLVELGPLQK
jgi:hypothetical protein